MKQFVKSERFTNQGKSVEGMSGGIDVRQCARNHKDRRLRMDGAETPGQFQTIGLRHGEISYQEVNGRRGSGQPERFRGPLSLKHVVPLTGKNLRLQGSECGIIIHDQEGRRFTDFGIRRWKFGCLGRLS